MLEIFKARSHCAGTIPLSWPERSRSSGMMSHHDWRLHWLQSMARSSSVFQCALAWCIAELPYWPLRCTADFLHPIHQNSLHMLGVAKSIHWGFKTHWLPLPDLAYLSEQFIRVWPLSHATATWSHRWELGVGWGPKVRKLPWKGMPSPPPEELPLPIHPLPLSGI